MFYNNFKNEALEAHNKAVNSYRRIYDSFVKQCEKLYKIRIKACNTIELILTLINSIANKPKEFVTDIEEISIEKQTFHDTEEYQNKANDSLKFSALGTVAGISVGTVVATASSAAYAGPIGLGIGVGATAASVLKLSFDNKKIGKKAIEETETIRGYTYQVQIGREIVKSIRHKIFILNIKLKMTCLLMGRLKNADYEKLSNKDKVRLGTLVNNTLTLTHLVNEKIG